MSGIITFKDLGKNGRLGNQLFQIAATVATGLKNNLTPVFPEWRHNIFLNDSIGTGKVEPTDFYIEPRFEYQEIKLSEAHQFKVADIKVYDLAGYYQSEKHFHPYQKFVKAMFALNDSAYNLLYANIARQGLDRHLFEPANKSCAIHVRRGDYVNNLFYATLGMEYYNKSIDKMCKEREIERFIVFSDDIEWCKEHFLGNKFLFVEPDNEFLDLKLMSFCRHLIIANSTYSWWAAFLSFHPDKYIIFPANWFGPNCSHNPQDLYFNEGSRSIIS